MLLEVVAAAAMSCVAAHSPLHGRNLKLIINWRIAMIIRVRQLAVSSAVRNAHFYFYDTSSGKEEVSQPTGTSPAVRR